MSRIFRIVTVLSASLWSAAGCAQVERLAPTPPTTYFLAIDVTASQAAEDFARYPLVAHEALSLLRPGDKVVVLLLDGSSEPVVQSVNDVERHQSSVLKTASQVGRAVRALTLSKNMKGTTDLGGILAHVGRQIDLERAVEPNSPRAYRLLWVSDGQPTGKQTRADWRGFADVDLRVAFFGATPGARAKVEHLFSDGGFGGVDHLLVVEHSHVHQMLPQLAPFFGRRPNPDLEKRLAALDARA